MSLRVYRDGEPPAPHVGRAVKDPVRLAERRIRSAREYALDPNPKLSEIKTVQKALRCIKGKHYIFFASPPKPGNRIRSKKGLFWNHPEMKKLKSVDREVHSYENHTSLVSLLDLSDYEFDHSEELVLNWASSVFLISDIDLEELFEKVGNWHIGKTKGTISLNIERIFSDLGTSPPLAILRHYAADNGRDEIIVVAGHRHFLNDDALACLSQIDLHSNR